MVDYVFAGGFHGWGDFCLDEGEIAVDGFLENPTLGFYAAVHRIFLHDRIDLLFSEKDGGSHVIVILFDAGFAAACFLPGAAICCAE